LTEIALILEDRYLSRMLLPAQASEAIKAMITPSI